MNSPQQSAPVQKKDVYTTRLTAAERHSGTLFRKFAYVVLLAASLAACLLAVFCWYQWFVTARVCVRTYVLQESDSLLFSSGAAKTWQAYLSGLDISSFSALIFAFFFTRLAYTGIRNTLGRRLRDGATFFENAYDSVLFPDYFESLCIRFGLLGTLLSFLLAAVSQLAEPAAATQVARPGSLGARVEQLAQEPIEPGAVAPVPREEVPSTPKTGKTSRLSSQVFLLLCASLVSTFVGTFVAYIMIPPMNLLNDGAVGMLQRGRTDEANTAEEFFRQLDRTSQRLAEFETATAALSSAADGVVRFRTATNEAAESFAQAVSLMGDLKHQYKELTLQTNELVRRLASFEHQSSRMTEGIRTFYENLQKPLDRMYQAALRIEHSAEAENNAAQAVAHLTRTVQGPLSVIHAAGTYRWKTMSDIRDSLKLLADEEGSQRDAFIEVAGAFTHIGAILSELMQGLDAFLVEQMQARGDREEVEKRLEAMRHQLAVIREQLNRDYGKGLPSEAELKERPKHHSSISERLARRGREPRSGGRWWGRFSQWLRRNGAKTGTSSKDEPDADSSAEVPTEEIL